MADDSIKVSSVWQWKNMAGGAADECMLVLIALSLYTAFALLCPKTVMLQKTVLFFVFLYALRRPVLLFSVLSLSFVQGSAMFASATVYIVSAFSIEGIHE